MKFQKNYSLILFTILTVSLFGQSALQSELSWEITQRESIVLHVDDNAQLPHKDNIELSGKKVSAIVYYAIDEDKNLTIENDIIFPQLRTYNKSNEPDWKKFRAYFRRNSGATMAPSFGLGERVLVPSIIDSIEINGMISFYYAPVEDLKFTKQIYPSMDDRFLVEEWHIENLSAGVKTLSVSNFDYRQSEEGYKGDYTFIAQSSASDVSLSPGESYTFPVIYGALLNEESVNDIDFLKAKKSRLDFINICKDNLILNTPNDTLNKLFYFSKIRASESIFNSSMGLVHSPGGGNYYVGIWANDQIEYSGPFFPYLGYGNGNTAAYNAYMKFMENIPKDDGHIPYAFEVDGNFPMTHLDRGDAAMIAYGTSLFLLNAGNLDQAKHLWPLITWSIEYCNNNRNEFGAVISESDEMEGRIETGDANLSTSTLYYGGLKFASRIARDLDLPDQAKIFEMRLAEMEQVIENYFGANIGGIDTYRYFDKNKYLRHWICLPLTMGIDERKEGTLKALFDTLWTDNGILVQYNPTDTITDHTYWDRATLYALRGALKVGETHIAIERLKQYSANRLLGDHVPYAVEAFPENNMKHLSAESALYCRIYIEGLLGIEPISFTEFEMSPKLPSEWKFLELSRFYLYGTPYDISINRENEHLRVIVTTDAQVIYDETINQYESVHVDTNGY